MKVPWAELRFLAACRGVGDVAFGLKTGRGEYIEAGRRALDLCLGGLNCRTRRNDTNWRHSDG